MLGSGEFWLCGGFLALYAATAARTVGFGDSGEAVACGSCWGVLHSPGNPLYVLGVALAQLGGRPTQLDPAFATHLLSCVAAAAALLLLFRLVRQTGAGRGGAALATLTLGLAPAFWDAAHAARPDTLALAWLLGSWGSLRAGRTRWAGWYWGLALATHPVGALLALPVLLLLLTHRPAPAAAVLLVGLWQRLSGTALVGWLPALLLLAVASRDRRLKTPRLATAMDLKLLARGCAPALLLFVYLPLRAWADPALNWGDATSPARLWNLLSLHDFQALYTPGPLNATGARLLTGWTTLRHQFVGGALLPLALLGWGGLAWRRPLLFYASSLAVLVQGGWLLFGTRLPLQSNTSDPCLLSLTVISLWVSAGGVVALRLMCWGMRKALHTSRWSGHVVRCGWILLCLLPLWSVRSSWREVQRAHETFAADYGHNVLSTAAPDALLLTRSDDATFPLLYWQVSRGYRSDVRVVFTDLLELEWYRAQLRRRGLHVPSRFGEIASWAIANSERPVQADVWAARAMGGRMQATMQGVLFNFRGVDAGPDQRTLLSGYRSDGVFEARVRKDEATEQVLQAYSLALDALGQQLASAGQVEAAVEQWKRAIQVAPQREVTAHLLLARAWKDQGKPDQVEAELDAVLRIEPANVAAHQLLFQNSRDLAPSRPLPPPNDPVAFNQQRASQLNQEGVQAILGRPPDPARAAQLWKEAARLDPRLGQPHLNLGNLHRAQGELRAALREYQEALRLQPDLAITHFNLGDVFEKLGDPARALDHYRQEVARGRRADNQGVFDQARARVRALQSRP